RPAGRLILVSTFLGSLIAGFTPTLSTAQQSLAVHPDPMGSVASRNATCPSGGVASGVCYKLTISCPNIATMTAHLKVNRPSGTSVGSVIFSAGGNGVGYYEKEFKFGQTAVQAVLSGGYTTAQINFDGLPAGWMDGPGGPRALACRYATVAR